MKYLIPIWVLCLAHFFTHAQNMVPNGNFEYYNTCPIIESQLSNCLGWRSYHQGTSDYFNSCNSSGTIWGGVPHNQLGYQSAANGNAYAGICSHVNSIPSKEYREYLTRSILPLTKGIRYDVSMSVSLSGPSKYSSNSLAVWFYDVGPSSTISGDTALRVVPKISYAPYGYIRDTANWVRLESDFIADSAYDNIVIGNFTQDVLLKLDTVHGYNSYSYYYIDSVVVKIATGLINLFSDTTLCTGDTFNVPFLIRNKFYASSNIFSVQLSNISGSFSSNTSVIGTLNSDTSGTIRCVIPNSIVPGNNYRMRIISSNVTDSSKDGHPISIGTVRPQVVANTDTAVCPGQSIRLNALATPATNTTYSWTGPLAYTSNAQSSTIINATTTMSGSYIVTAKLFGCLAKDTMDAIVINGNNSLKLKTSNPACENDTLNLSVTTLGTATSSSWIGPNSFSSSGFNTFVSNVQSLHAGRYSVIVSYNGTCYAYDTANISVKPLPATFTTATNSPICANSTLTLSANSSSSGVTYSWSGPNTFSSTLQAPAISNAQPTASGDYYITATLNGCSINDTVPVVVTAIPPRPLTTANSPVCIGQALNLTAISTAGVTYIWNGPSGFMQLTQNPTISNANSSHAGSYRVRAIDNGCASIEDTVNIVVITAPNVGIYPSPSDTICQGARLTLVGTPTNGGSAPQYQWYKNNIAIPSATTTSYISNTTADKDIFYCTMTTTGLCADPYTDTSNHIPITVLPWLTPSVSIAATPSTPVNGGDMITFNATPINGGTKPVYQWKRNNADVIGAISNTWGSPNLANADTICVVMTSSYRCPSPATAKSNCIVVQINTTGIETTTLLNNIKIYPNPVTDAIHIEGIQPATTIQLFDVTGRLDINTTAQQPTATISTNALAAGTYILQLTLPDGQKLNSKIIKQ